MLRILSDVPADPFAHMPQDLSPVWWIVGIVAAVAAVTAVLIVVLVKKKKRG